MSCTVAKKICSCSLSCLLLIALGPHQVASQQQGPPPGYTGQGAPLSAQDLQQLVAPIALYPDALVAQILGGAAFSDQIAEANNWMLANSNLQGSVLMQAVNAQPWEPSVKALTQFPSVLDNMAKNLSWTSALGEAYSTQAADVMTAVQILRAKAYATGNLKSGSQITVVQESPQVIVIQPTNPQVVYVPQYNPTIVYGTPYVTPGYSTAAVVATGVLAFGVGMAVGAAMSSSCCGWSYASWNCNWHGGTVVYGHTTYYGNNAWHGGYYGSSATAVGPNGAARVGSAYNPSTGTYARGAETVTPYGTQKAGQAYNPNTGAYAQTHQTSNAYGSYGNSEYSKNGQTTSTQHESTAQDRCQPCRARTVPRLLPGPRPADNITQRVNQQAAPSTRSKMATFTRTLGVDGSRPSPSLTTIKRHPQEAVLPQKAGDSKKRAVDRQPLEAARAVGNPDPRVLVVRRAAVVAEVGVAGKALSQTGEPASFMERCLS
jgi:hypothetical protein